MANRKTINIPCTSLTSSMSDTVKDKDLMPPPSSIHTQDYGIQCESSNSMDTNRKFFSKSLY